MALTRKKLDEMGCGMPNCDHDHTVLYFHSRCHLAAGTTAKYDKRTGLVTMMCRECEKFICEIKVAK
jgi:hypothetical protein